MNALANMAGKSSSSSSSYYEYYSSNKSIYIRFSLDKRVLLILFSIYLFLLLCGCFGNKIWCLPRMIMKLLQYQGIFCCKNPFKSLHHSSTPALGHRQWLILRESEREMSCYLKWHSVCLCVCVYTRVCMCIPLVILGGWVHLFCWSVHWDRKFEALALIHLLSLSSDTSHITVCVWICTLCVNL